MNDRELLDLLEELDGSASSVEEPPGFDRLQAERGFAALVGGLLLRFGRVGACETGVFIQDASFHGQIDLTPRPAWDQPPPAIRLSNWGNLATVTGANRVEPEERLAETIATLEEFGYVYVPERLLDLAYTGGNPGVDGIGTWGIRFFDFI